MDLRALVPAVGLAAFPVTLAAQEVHACQTLTLCEDSSPCIDIDRPLRLEIARRSAALTDEAGRSIPLGRRLDPRGQTGITAFAAVSPGGTALLLSFDPAAGLLVVTEHTRDAGPVTLTATCRLEED